MNRIIFVFCIVILSLGAVGSTFFVLNTDSPLPNIQRNLADVIEKVEPATVSITGTSSNGTIITTREGTGIIVDSDGLILTSKHLVSPEFTYTIVLQDGTKMYAKLLKIHPARDIALLKIVSETPLSLPVGAFINSQANVRKGDTVIAIGTMLGLYPGSVSEGIISGLNRTVSFGETSITGLIQTNISMNLGNSGGPLIASDGKIVGINTGIVGGSSQIGWALPLTQEEVDAFIR